MKRKHGFTLLEIMLVLVLVSAMAVTVVATLPVRHDDEIKQVAQSVFQRLQLLNEEAILSGRDYGLRIDEQARQLLFLSLEQDGWQKLEKDGIAAELPVDEGLAVQFKAGGDVWQDEDRLFKPGSLFDEEMFSEPGEARQQRPPQVFILSSGELTPFTLDIYVQNQPVERGWQVQVQDNGQINLLAPGEHDETR